MQLNLFINLILYMRVNNISNPGILQILNNKINL
jgi:hypothetical protein